MSIVNYWCITDIKFKSIGGNSYVQVYTDTNVSLTMHRSSYKPKVTNKYRIVRGISLPCLPQYTLQNQSLYYQDEFADGKKHSFITAPWPPPSTFYLFFSGKSMGFPTVSQSPLYIFSNLCPVPGNWPCAFYCEEQPLFNDWLSVRSSPGPGEAQAQLITIINRSVFKLGFYLRKKGSPPGYFNYCFRIWSATDDSVLSSSDWYPQFELSSSGDWIEHEMPEVELNEQVRIGVYATLGTSTDGLEAARYNLDVKPDEMWSKYLEGAWSNFMWADFTYRYYYLLL